MNRAVGAWLDAHAVQGRIVIWKKIYKHQAVLLRQKENGDNITGYP
jgi:hypothetical protein